MTLSETPLFSGFSSNLAGPTGAAGPLLTPFKQDRKLTDILSEQKFTLSAEVIPPRNGSEQGKVLQQIQALISAGAQFLAVTKGAGGSLRGGSLPIVQVIKESFG